MLDEQFLPESSESGGQSCAGRVSESRVAEVSELLEKVKRGKASKYRLEEAMTSSDFPLVFGDILDRMLIKEYQDHPSIWQQFAAKRLVSSFRNVNSYTGDGVSDRLSEVAELAPYPAAALSESRVQWRVKKYGRRVPFSWELLLLDDLNMLERIPLLLAQAARRTENYQATDLIASSTGPDGTVYSVGNANIVTANPSLSIAGLQTAMTVIGNQTDALGSPVYIEMMVLMVPPALEVVANNILNASMITVGADSADQRISTANWMSRRMQLVVNPMLPIISTTNGNTSWYLFASPNNGRPAVECGVLRGHEAPEMFLKTPNAQRIGGGAAGPEDFDTDSIEYKIRHSFGGAVIDAKMTVASNGTNV